MAIPARNQRIKDVLKRGQQEKIAKLLGVTRQNVQQLLNGKKEVSDVDLLKAVAQVANVSYEWLVTGEDLKEQSIPEMAQDEIQNAIQKKYILYLENKVGELHEELAKYKRTAMRVVKGKAPRGDKD